MTDRETLEKVAKGYHELMAMQEMQNARMAAMTRLCVTHMDSTNAVKRKEGRDSLLHLAETLENRKDPK